MSALADTVHSGTLADAFSSFIAAAGSLERCYTQLEGEVARLRSELEESNRDRDRSLEENRRVRQYLKLILENLPCGVLVVDGDGRVAVANPETERLVGIAAQEELPGWMNALLPRLTSAPAELEFLAAQSTAIAIRPAHFENSEGQASIFILEDVSEAKRLQQEREIFRRRQALGQMSTLLAHEIRNPLGSLELFAGLLASSDLTDDCRNWVEHLQAGLRTLTATVNNVLHFHSVTPCERAPLSLADLLDSVAGFLRPLAQQSRVRLEVRHRLDGVMVSADRHRLEQVLLNLALNAFRFMPGGGLVRIAGGRRDRRAWVEVADTGPGIAPDTLASIFEPGFSTRPGSPGLGLAVCRTIVEQHGGTIDVCSQPGRGARFIFEIPLVSEPS
jgi:two-component system sensor histidine kinase FlrB